MPRMKYASRTIRPARISDSVAMAGLLEKLHAQA
jgi:hypothetical protein